MFSETFERRAFAQTLQKKLRILRAAAGVSQADVATALGLVRSTYVSYENGSKEIPWEKCLALLFYFESNPGSREILSSIKILPESVRRFHHDD